MPPPISLTLFVKRRRGNRTAASGSNRLTRHQKYKGMGDRPPIFPLLLPLVTCPSRRIWDVCVCVCVCKGVACVCVCVVVRSWVTWQLVSHEYLSRYTLTALYFSVSSPFLCSSLPCFLRSTLKEPSRHHRGPMEVILCLYVFCVWLQTNDRHSFCVFFPSLPFHWVYFAPLCLFDGLLPCVL